jgi:NDP-sugar pyrophosphorylase family protein
MVSIVYLVAGLSSRFGGKIKQFAKIGKSGETLIELSMLQAINAGFDKIVFVVGEKTEVPFKEKFGNSFNKTPIFYTKQEFDLNSRDKPWGTVDALLSAKKIINEDFVVCNGDDLYGENSFEKARIFLENNNSCVAIGYELEKVLPENGKTNRGIFEVDENNNIIEIKEVFDIEKNNLEEKNLKNNSLASMNLFGLKKNTINLLEKKLSDFKKENFENRKIECLLPVELSNLILEKKIEMKLLASNDDWFGVTNPEDEEIIRKKLQEKNTY